MLVMGRRRRRQTIGDPSPGEASLQHGGLCHRGAGES